MMQDRHPEERALDRRVFLRSGIIFSGAAFAGVGLLHGAEAEKKNKEKEAEVGPPEDLMREHGVLKRVLLIYDEVLRRIDAKQDFPPEALADAARIIRSFVEDYHEKLEEDFLFPALRKSQSAGGLGESAARATSGWAARHGCNHAVRESATAQKRIGAGAAHQLHAAIHPYVQSARGARGHRSLSGLPQDRFGA
jgi:hypothetical protein